MVSSEERLKILNMIQEGKITPDEGIKLLEAMETPVRPEKPNTPQVIPGREPGFLRIVVTDTDSGRNRVNIRLPISVVDAGFKMGAKFSPEVQGLDAKQLMGFVKAGVTGQVVDIIDEDDGEHVQVFLE